MRWSVSVLTVLFFCVVVAQQQDGKREEPVFELVEPKEALSWPETLKMPLKEVKPTLPMDEEVEGEFEWFSLKWGETEYYIGHDLTQRYVVIFRKEEKQLRFVRDFVGVGKTRRIKLRFTFVVGGGRFTVRVPIGLRILKEVAEIGCWWESRIRYGQADLRVVWRPGREPVVVDGSRRGIWRVYVGGSRLTAAVTLKDGKPSPVIVPLEEKGLLPQEADGLTFVEMSDGQVRGVHYADDEGKIWLPAGRLGWARGVKLLKQGKVLWRLDLLLSGFDVEKGGRIGPVEPLKLVPIPVVEKGKVAFPFELRDARGRTLRILRNGRPVTILPEVVVRHKGKEVFRGRYRLC